MHKVLVTSYFVVVVIFDLDTEDENQKHFFGKENLHLQAHYETGKRKPIFTQTLCTKRRNLKWPRKKMKFSLVATGFLFCSMLARHSCDLHSTVLEMERAKRL